MRLNETLLAVVNRKTNNVTDICQTKGIAIFSADIKNEDVIQVRIIPVKGAKK